MLDQRSIAQTVVVLSLDAMSEFYNYIGITQYDYEIHGLFKDIVKSVNCGVIFRNVTVEKLHGSSTYDAIYNMLALETQKLPEAQAQFLREWMWNAYSGQHCSDVSLSSWSTILRKWSISGFLSEGYNEAEYDMVAALLEDYKRIMDYFSFCDEADAVAEKGELTDYDREVHRLYGYNYYDDICSPFTMMYMLHESYKLRKLARESKVFKQADFPFEKLHRMAMQYMAEYRLWGNTISDIRMIRDFQPEEYQCPKQVGNF